MLEIATQHHGVWDTGTKLWDVGPAMKDAKSLPYLVGGVTVLTHK